MEHKLAEHKDYIPALLAKQGENTKWHLGSHLAMKEGKMHAEENESCYFQIHLFGFYLTALDDHTFALNNVEDTDHLWIFEYFSNPSHSHCQLKHKQTGKFLGVSKGKLALHPNWDCEGCEWTKHHSLLGGYYSLQNKLTHNWLGFTEKSPEEKATRIDLPERENLSGYSITFCTSTLDDSPIWKTDSENGEPTHLQNGKLKKYLVVYNRKLSLSSSPEEDQKWLLQECVSDKSSIKTISIKHVETGLCVGITKEEEKICVTLFSDGDVDDCKWEKIQSSGSSYWLKNKGSLAKGALLAAFRPS